MKKTTGNSVKDLWMLSTNIAVMGYILVVTFLLNVFNFDQEISESIKALSVTIFFILSVLLAYSYRQELKKSEGYKRIFEECLASFSNYECKEACTPRKCWQKLIKSKVRRFSYPIASFECSSYQQNWKHDALKGCLQCNLHDLETETRKASSNEPNRTSCKGYGNISVILHNCVKDLENVIKSVKSLNLAYMKSLEDTFILNQNLGLVSQKDNSGSQISEKVKDLPLKNTNLEEKNSTAMSISSWPQIDRDLTTKMKPMESTKLAPANSLTHCLWKYLLQNRNTPNLPESVSTNFLLKSVLLDIKESGCIFHRIAPNQQDNFSMESIDSLLQAGKVIINFYKTKAVARDEVELLVSFKKHVSKIPMRPYVRQISMTKHMQEMSRERYIYALSKRKAKVSNKQRVSKVTRRITKILPTVPAQGFITSVDEMLLSVKQSLAAVMSDSYALSNDILISKFDESDFKNFAEVYQELNDYY